MMFALLCPLGPIRFYVTLARWAMNEFFDQTVLTKFTVVGSAAPSRQKIDLFDFIVPRKTEILSQMSRFVLPLASAHP